jgi:hypothetical protein
MTNLGIHHQLLQSAATPAVLQNQTAVNHPGVDPVKMVPEMLA